MLGIDIKAAHGALLTLTPCELFTEDEEEREISRKTGDYLRKSSDNLPPTYLEYKPVSHANKAQPHRVCIIYMYIR